MQMDLSTSSRIANRDIVGIGHFWKLGRVVKNWKHRSYRMGSNGLLEYFSESGNKKGELVLHQISATRAAQQHIYDALYNNTVGGDLYFDAVSVQLLCQKPTRNLFLVFETLRDAKDFIGFASQVSIGNNLRVSRIFITHLLFVIPLCILFTVVRNMQERNAGLLRML